MLSGNVDRGASGHLPQQQPPEARLGSLMLGSSTCHQQPFPTGCPLTYVFLSSNFVSRNNTTEESYCLLSFCNFYILSIELRVSKGTPVIYISNIHNNGQYNEYLMEYSLDYFLKYFDLTLGIKRYRHFFFSLHLFPAFFLLFKIPYIISRM